MKPHRSQYWLNNKREEDPETFDAQVNTICELYAEAATLTEEDNKHIISSDEKTGIQALERKHPTKPMQPSSPEKREYEYQRHGTQALIASFDVTNGQLIGTVGDTRTEVDFVNHIEQVVETDPDATWVFVVDQLNTHKSASLVQFVADRCQLGLNLGVKGKSGILHTMVSRAAFLQDDTHRIRFVYTPKHCSWLNQVEIWFSILYRRVLKRGHFTSKEMLRQRLLDFIDYFNATLAKPFKWTYKGRPLVA